MKIDYSPVVASESHECQEIRLGSLKKFSDFFYFENTVKIDKLSID